MEKYARKYRCNLFIIIYVLPLSLSSITWTWTFKGVSSAECGGKKTTSKSSAVWVGGVVLNAALRIKSMSAGSYSLWLHL